MPILYALIARGPVVLAEYSEKTGNFPTVTRVLLGKIDDSADCRKSIKADEYTFHFVVEGGLTLAPEGHGRRGLVRGARRPRALSSASRSAWAVTSSSRNSAHASPAASAAAHACRCDARQPISALRARAVLVDMEEGVLGQVMRSPLGELFEPRQVLSDVECWVNALALQPGESGALYVGDEQGTLSVYRVSAAPRSSRDRAQIEPRSSRD